MININDPSQKQKLNALVNEGVAVLQEIQDLRDGLKDTAKTLADELDVKPSVLLKSIRIAFKASIEEEKENFENIEEILEAAGRK